MPYFYGMLPVSIVVLTKNEEQNIARCLESVNGLSDDILVLDSGSTDATVSIASALGARVVPVTWIGYGATKNEGNRLARYDWILSLDADEELNPELREAIQSLFTSTPSPSTVYALRRRMVYGRYKLQHGSVATEFRIRLFNRNTAHWSTDAVHENIIGVKAFITRKLNGHLWHYSYPSVEAHRQRLEQYAQLSARQMRASGIHAGVIKRFFSPLFHFIKNFIFRLGFLDGPAGYRFAKNEMWYVWRKYELLHAGVNEVPS